MKKNFFVICSALVISMSFICENALSSDGNEWENRVAPLVKDALKSDGREWAEQVSSFICQANARDLTQDAGKEAARCDVFKAIYKVYAERRAYRGHELEEILKVLSDFNDKVCLLLKSDMEQHIGFSKLIGQDYGLTERSEIWEMSTAIVGFLQCRFKNKQ